MKKSAKKPVAVQIVPPHVKYSDKATKARLNTAANKMFFEKK